jgi:hypothetical protein
VAFQPRGASRPSLRARLGSHLMLAVVLCLTLGACGFNVQTAQVYTPADGVNAEIGGVKVRNLMILSESEGSGFLSASLLSEVQRDSLTDVQGTAQTPEGPAAQPLSIEVGSPIVLPPDDLIVLTEGAPIRVSGQELKPGLTADLELTFAEAGTLAITVPVVSTEHGYADALPPTPEATPAS